MKKREKEKTNSSAMKRWRSILITVLCDTAFAVLAYYLARTIMFFKLDEASQPLGYKDAEIAIAAAAIVTTIVMFVIFDCYNALWRYAGRVEFFKFLMSYIADFAVLFVFKIILKVVVSTEVWVPLILMYLLFSAIFSGSIRFFYGIVQYFKHVRYMVDDKSMPGMKRTIVIGAGYTGSLAINRFINNPSDGYYPVAVVDDDVNKQGRRIYGIEVEGGVDQIPEIVARHKAEAFVIAIMSITKSQLRHIYDACAPFNLPIKIMPSITNANEMANSVKSLRDIKIEELLGRDEFKVKQELIDVAVKDKVVMVTGGAGSIGSELCRQVLNFGCKHLIIFDQHENGMFFLNQEFVKKYDTSRYTLVMGTVRERDKLIEVIGEFKPDIIFHAAAYKHVPMMEISATEAIKNNVFGTLNVIEVAESMGVKKFVLISTDKAVNPSNIMGASKRIAEMLIETRGKTGKMQMAAVRFGNVLGSNGSVIPVFLSQIKEGGPITLTDRYIKRYFMSIPEAVRLVLQTGAFADSGEIFVLDMGEPVYIYDLACDLIRLNGLVPEQDIEIKVTGLRPGEKMFEELRYDTEAVDTTAHEGVFVNRLESIDRAAFDEKLARLRSLAFEEDVEGTTDMIFTIVPSEYRKKKESPEG
ncbi:MAG TPA: nucleoside-diphosphate sugar epimerase [Clostridiales bacterium]|nr:nucleoside-diphosphate sugar epimerase [Clostridiales bacterium]